MKNALQIRKSFLETASVSSVTTHGLAKEREHPSVASVNQRETVKLENVSNVTLVNVIANQLVICKMKTPKRNVCFVNMVGSNVVFQTRRIHFLFVFVLVEYFLVTMPENSKNTFASAQDSQNKNATKKLDIVSVSIKRHNVLFSLENSDSWDF
jgi:hypothetical protein